MIHEIVFNPAYPLAESHYQEPGWDNCRLNNVNQHFITAILGSKPIGEFARCQPYLDLITPISNDSPRTEKTDPKYCKGFTNWPAIGMEFHLLDPRKYPTTPSS
ncbi:MAG: hypothetical protein GY896_14745 [Gammaproteobacteria bacterium]|nr:hypothetical protein [Gammaproteobacteria bacterium]